MCHSEGVEEEAKARELTHHHPGEARILWDALGRAAASKASRRTDLWPSDWGRDIWARLPYHHEEAAPDG